MSLQKVEMQDFFNCVTIYSVWSIYVKQQQYICSLL